MNVGDLDQMTACFKDPNMREGTKVISEFLFYKFSTLQEAGFTCEEALQIVIHQGVSSGGAENFE